LTINLNWKEPDVQEPEFLIDLFDSTVVRLKEWLTLINGALQVVTELIIACGHLDTGLRQHEIEVASETLGKVDDWDIGIVSDAGLKDGAHVLVSGVAKDEVRRTNVVNITLERVLLDIEWCVWWADENLTWGSHIETELTKKILKGLDLLERLGSEPTGCEIYLHFDSSVVEIDIV
jgi:hypothetical protein